MSNRYTTLKALNRSDHTERLTTQEAHFKISFSLGNSVGTNNKKHFVGPKHPADPKTQRAVERIINRNVDRHKYAFAA